MVPVEQRLARGDFAPPPRVTCEDCLHFGPSAESAVPTGELVGVCDLLYPTEPHRKAVYEAKVEGDPVLFCKMFEAS